MRVSDVVVDVVPLGSPLRPLFQEHLHIGVGLESVVDGSLVPPRTRLVGVVEEVVAVEEGLPLDHHAVLVSYPPRQLVVPFVQFYHSVVDIGAGLAAWISTYLDRGW